MCSMLYKIFFTFFTMHCVNYIHVLLCTLLEILLITRVLYISEKTILICTCIKFYSCNMYMALLEYTPSTLQCTPRTNTLCISPHSLAVLSWYRTSGGMPGMGCGVTHYLIVNKNYILHIYFVGTLNTLKLLKLDFLLIGL